MNKELKRVSIVVLIMFIALFSSTTVIQAFESDSLQADERNVRTLYASYSIERGPILVNGQPIAESIPSDDLYKFQRQYPGGALYEPVTGYFPINGQATGIEQALNGYLSGSSNSQFFDKINGIITGQKPKGASVEITIDPHAQQAAWDALGNQQGAIIVTEPSSGRVLAMVSKPTFDPNLMAAHNVDEVDETYHTLLDNPNDPLFNRSIGGNLNPPGSVFKLVVASAALESGRYTPDSTFANPAQFQLPGSSAIIHNTDRGTCGSGSTATLATAIELSCNIPFAELGLQLGSKAILEQAEKFGFNTEIDIPVPVEPSVYPRNLDDAQTALSAFGQFDVRATPLQIALICAAIANGGILKKPNLIEQVQAPNLSILEQFRSEDMGRPISAETAKKLTQIMIAGTNSGAATNARIEGVSVAGKTSTAENGGDEPYTLWFTGFAPTDNPQYAITVLVENGGGLGQAGYGNLIAAPIAKQVLEAVLNK
jgi:peptidoglycan glycosyltransferase